MEMTTTSAQKMSESTPSTLSCVTGDGVRPVEALAQRVERAGADVAEDHAQRRERHDRQGPATVATTVASGDD